ncbi:ribonuclease HI [Sulfurimonas sp.]|uniref:ribonuclease HI n=1 Tax=Sulfurimonas sp. TaxID=2022749 RepID=UPI003D098975
MIYVDRVKPTFFLFTDASVNPQTNVGYGAYLLLAEYELEAPHQEERVRIKRFTKTTSSKLELQTLLWALSEIKFKKRKIIIFTDCQNLISLQDRRERIIKNNYMTKKNELLRNHELYKKFYTLVAHNECDFVKVKGHKKTQEKDFVDNLFTLVDRASREALRDSLT